jgi:hypothetical protein
MPGAQPGTPDFHEAEARTDRLERFEIVVEQDGQPRRDRRQGVAVMGPKPME